MSQAVVLGWHPVMTQLRELWGQDCRTQSPGFYSLGECGKFLASLHRFPHLKTRKRRIYLIWLF